MRAINLVAMSKSQPPRNNHNTSTRDSEDNTAVSAEIQTASFSGPMPHPSILAKYEEIVPGAAERILVMAESSMRHQQEYDHAVLEASKQQLARGQILGFLIGISAIGASVYAAILGYPWLAAILGGTTVVGLVTAFVVGRLVSKKE